MIKQSLSVPLAGCLLAMACAQANAAPNPYTNFVVFGDSLNDAGTFADTGGPAGATKRFTNRTGPVYLDGSGEVRSLNSTQILGGKLGFSPDQTASSASAVHTMDIGWKMLVPILLQLLDKLIFTVASCRMSASLSAILPQPVT